MRIAQIILSSATHYERKCQRVDHAGLSDRHEVVLTTLEGAADARCDVAHLYAGASIPGAGLVGFPLPYVSSAPVAASRWSLRKPVLPRYVVSPLADEPSLLPEAVEDVYFTEAKTQRVASDRKVVGSFARESTRNAIDQTMARIYRYRDDIDWLQFDHAPSLEDLRSVDLWADPAMADDDFDGFVAEALVAEVPVVAARTPINLLRLEKGRTGALVPPGDANEMTHAILAALFKPEGAQNRLAAARQTITKFKARQRLRLLTHMYETLTR
jgi:glycosyltransferase involved in cell wall biosynthesis